jgi:hypothetical protein
MMLFDMDWNDADQCFVGWLPECGMCCHDVDLNALFRQIENIHEAFKVDEDYEKERAANTFARFRYYKAKIDLLNDEKRQLKQKINDLECKLFT